MSFVDTIKLKKYSAIADKVMSLESQMSALKDADFPSKTSELKSRYAGGESLDQLLPEAFALVREAAKRVLGLFPYKVQIIGGIALHEGNISEMRTGEGKTLTATMPVYLNALTGDGVHVVTVNEYLASRDAQEMGALYQFLGLTTGLNLSELTPYAKRRAYACDITYTTGSELGFDYLRDNMALDTDYLTQRGLNYAIVDEIDSILIDEARTPLIIAGQSSQSTMMYFKVDHFVKSLKSDDYIVDIESKTVRLSHQGIDKAEEHFRVAKLYDDINVNLVHHIDQALYANYVMVNGVDYIVKDQEIAIVDTFTGRVMDGRQFSDGLHQALEAKENVKVNDETVTQATITYQNFFRMYKKLSGMTGTAKTEEKEFKKTYDMNVITIPTNKPIQRIDDSDIIYSSLDAKFKAVVEEIKRVHATGQPLLVGTASVDMSEVLSHLLKQEKLPHVVLNARHDADEASIVAQAGQKGAITVATNMAGRGTDIKLGLGVVELGGLYVLGTEKHESRRIDNQLRGRAGRQGDVGYSRFFLSLEDDLVQRFGGEKMKKIYDRFAESDGDVTSSLLQRRIESAQKRIEGNNFDTRKNLLEYDDVMHAQRLAIYEMRQQILLNNDEVSKFCDESVEKTINENVDELLKGRKVDLQDIATFAWDTFKIDLNINDLRVIAESKQKLKDYVKLRCLNAYKDKLANNVTNLVVEKLKVITLNAIDNTWVQHLTNLEALKDNVMLRSYAQIQPVSEYQIEALELYKQLLERIRLDVTKTIMSEIL